ncbi:hypothetical protein ACIBG8_28710 [Nonomuraea sp. NPDC050556]|uniref:hypothetical protein n=1 Tax=Nonomuraea sp. NPDC050556 TaxID=3364369 RepID=UPI00378C16CE
MTVTQADRIAHQQRLLTALREELEARGITTVLVVAEGDRPALEVVDRRFRTRRVFVQISFCWFYWGDREDERVSFLKLPHAVSRIEQAARTGWHDGPQAELLIDFSKIVDAYRP